ncbi:MAG: enoyl-CoA hydratase [Betaproteobacteria bacterium]|nr:enoyl-CoA hydratase [Betaproteobacteria bacterium]
MDTLAPAQDTLVTLAIADGIATLTLNRPKQYNALSAATLDALHAAIDQVRDDQSVRVLLIAANGNAFCAGHDLKEMRAANDEAFVRRLFQRCSDMMLKLAKLPVPVIAEIQGMATAAGCQLVAQCDLAVAVDHAKFAVSGVNLGLFCSTPAVPLSRTISRKRAAEMLMTGEFIDANTALAWGLVNRVVPAAELRATTLALAETLKAKPRDALAMGKALLYRQMEAGIEAAYQDASATISCNFMQADAQEGVAAFLEKRAPNWPQSKNKP